MYYIEDDNKIIAYNEDLDKLQEMLQFKPEYSDFEIQETDRPIIDFEFADTPEYQEKKLEKTKENKIIENDTKRDTALNQGVTYKGVLFDSDTDQKVNLMATVETMPEGATVVWYGMDNQPLNCTKEDLYNIGGLITELHSFCWNKNALIKAEINNAETIKEVENIVIDYTESEETNEV